MGWAFVQNYFGLPFALIVVCAVFIPIYHRLKVVTAYEYLGQRFDQKTRLLGAFLFLLQRGLAAGITIYAPAIILSALLGWNLRLTILLAGLFVVVYTTSGGTTAVSYTQKWQMLVILAGMAVAFGMVLHRLPADVSFFDALSIGGRMGKLDAVDFSVDPQRRYTFWSGTARRVLPRALLFRNRSIAGAALSRRRVARRQPVRTHFQRHAQAADAVFHPPHRRDGLRLFPVRKAAALLQSTGL